MRSRVTPAMRATFPSSCAEPKTTTPEPSLLRRLSTNVRNCPRSSESSTRCASTWIPSTTTAWLAADATEEAADFIRTWSSSRRSFLISSSCEESLLRKFLGLLLAAELAQCAEPGYRLYAAHARGNSTFAEQLDQPDFPAGSGVGSATELSGEVADFHHPDLLAVLLTEQRHGVVFVHRDIDGHVLQCLHFVVGEHLAVDHLFYVGKLFLGNAR